jgi:PAS domain S-box-containing protein
VTDPKSETVVIANPAYAAMHGLMPDEVVGMSKFDFWTPAAQRRVEELDAAAAQHGHGDYEQDRVRKDGTIFPARIHNTTIRNDDGEPRDRIITVQDITKERQLEAELHQAQRLEAMGQLTAGVAHDFNNILQGIMANLELMEDDPGIASATTEQISTAMRLAEHAPSLTQQLLSFARKQALRPQQIDLSSFLEDFYSMMARTLDPRIKIDLVIEPGLSVLADKSHLRNALMNIAINARDAMQNGGHLHIEASAQPAIRESVDGNLEGLVVIRLTDTGTGIAPEHLSKVCDPFFSTKGLNGTGLGLSMVHGFARQSDGTLLITSEQEKGTCVELWLPRASTPSASAG